MPKKPCTCTTLGFCFREHDTKNKAVPKQPTVQSYVLASMGWLSLYVPIGVEPPWDNWFISAGYELLPKSHYIQARWKLNPCHTVVFSSVEHSLNGTGIYTKKAQLRTRSCSYLYEVKVTSIFFSTEEGVFSLNSVRLFHVILPPPMPLSCMCVFACVSASLRGGNISEKHIIF